MISANLKMLQGSRFTQPVIVKHLTGELLDLTGYSARMQIREYPDSTEVIAEYTTANGMISIPEPETGVLNLVVPSATTAGYDFGDAWYDVEIVDSGNDATRIMEGRISLSREVTR